MIAAGILGIILPSAVGLAATILIGRLLIASGKLHLINRMVPAAGSLVFDGTISLIIALMIWATWLSSIGWVLGALVGASMCVRGISRLALSLAVRRAVA